MCLCAGSAYDCIPTSTASYIILLRGAFCWMMGSLKGSGASNMLLIGHVSSFSSCFFKHLYSLSDLGVNMVDEVFGIFSTRDLSSFEIWPFQLSCLTDYPTWFFYMANKFNICHNTSFTFLESQSSKLKVFCACIETHAMHGMRSASPKKLFRVSIYCTDPSVSHSNS